MTGVQTCALPIYRSGNLRDSIKMTSISNTGFGRWEGSVGPTAKSKNGYAYGARVENLGYVYLRTGLQNSEAELRNIYRQEWERALA